MNLTKELWEKNDIEEFQKYLISLENISKKEWTKNILNTELPVLAIKTPVLKNIAKDISKGNYISFLNLNLNEYYENIVINGTLISKINDFNTMEKYLDKYVVQVDNWACCDLMSFNIRGKEKEFLSLAKKYMKSNEPFTRRMCFVILFNFVNYDEYLDELFNIINSFYNEEHYYVNMINAWLVCECLIKHRDETIKFLNSHKLNKFTINKTISKCRDSYRVSKDDKDMLLKYKIRDGKN